MKADLQRMFDDIAPTYDLLNRVLSLGMDVRWRKRAVKKALDKKGGSFLDLAAGTGDFSLAALRAAPRHLVAVDFALHTLLYARQKFRKENAAVSLTTGDALQLPFKSDSFDCVLVAFGVRNFHNLKKGLEEIHRVLRATGVVCILELTQPTLPLFAQFFRLYFHRIVPRIGRIVSGHTGAYRYLPASVDLFPEPGEITEMMKAVGFQLVQVEPMTLGVVTLFTGKK